MPLREKGMVELHTNLINAIRKNGLKATSDLLALHAKDEEAQYLFFLIDAACKAYGFTRNDLIESNQKGDRIYIINAIAYIFSKYSNNKNSWYAYNNVFEYRHRSSMWQNAKRWGLIVQDNHRMHHEFIKTFQQIESDFVEKFNLIQK